MIPYHPPQKRIAVVFDFDDTLAPDSTSSFLESLGLDVTAFWQETVNPLLQAGWDPVPAYLYKMIELSKGGHVERITKESLQNWGPQVKLHRGVTRIFSQLKDFAHEIDSELKLEFYLISSGIKEIVGSSKISKQFTDIWACDFSYSEDGGIHFPKNIVSFTDKTRYLFHIGKGLIGEDYKNRPFEVNRKVANERMRVPFQQMIFVGDGYTDIPCFSMIKSYGGVAFGVYDRENRDKWGRAWGFIEDDRVSNLVPADYTVKSALHNCLLMAIENIATKIKLSEAMYHG